MKDWIKEIQDSGKLIILNGGSKYSVSSYDSIDTRFWMKMDNVSVSDSKMTNPMVTIFSWILTGQGFQAVLSAILYHDCHEIP
jgi:hypothetical protein